MVAETLDIRRAERKARRAELAAFLKSRRARITPKELGLPPGPRRRTPGLRREEVAQLSGIGITWYTWLEQGRQINVSIQVLDAVARTLHLDTAERAHLYRLADVPTVPAPIDDEEIPGEIQTILNQLGPLPACLLSPRYDVLRYNCAYEALCPSCIEGEANMLWEAFTRPQCCNAFRSQPEDRARMVGYLRSAYGKNLGDPTWDAFVAKLCAASPEFATMWARNDVAMPVGRRVKVIQHPAVGELNMFVTSLAMPALSGAWIQIFTPADEANKLLLDQLRCMSDEERIAPRIRHQQEYHSARATALRS